MQQITNGILPRVKKVIQIIDRYFPKPFFYPFAMTKDEKAIFEQTIQDATYYLEFGMGGSTLCALQKSRANIYSVESDPVWINQMRKYLIVKRLENKRLTLHHGDIGPVREWGNPRSDNTKALFSNYSSTIFKRVDATKLDVVLIDGRFRVACALNTILKCSGNPYLKIMIHDFWGREIYHPVLSYLDVVTRVDTLGVFSIKKDVDLVAVEADYQVYQFNPD